MLYKDWCIPRAYAHLKKSTKSTVFILLLCAVLFTVTAVSFCGNIAQLSIPKLDAWKKNHFAYGHVPVGQPAFAELTQQGLPSKYRLDGRLLSVSHSSWVSGLARPASPCNDGGTQESEGRPVPSVTHLFAVGTVPTLPTWPHLTQWEREMVFVSSRKICRVMWQRPEHREKHDLGPLKQCTPSLHEFLHFSFLANFPFHEYVLLMKKKKHLTSNSSENR